MLKTLKRPRIRIGAGDDGRPMTLRDFDRATVQEGYLYELGKGVIQVSEIPGPDHAMQVQAIRNQLVIYQERRPDVISLLAGSNDAKLLTEQSQSERHPDLSLYFTPPPDIRDVWSVWYPYLVVEVVSRSSAKRDYEEKPREYLEIGVREYWIVDSFKDQMTVLVRWRGQWQEEIIKPSRRYSTPHLPGFKLNLKRVFDAARIGRSK